MSVEPEEVHGIGWAFKQMWNGYRLRRRGWNGKGMWLKLVQPGDLTPARGLVDDWLRQLQPFVMMRTADRRAVPWLCSQSDLLAMDWETVPLAEIAGERQVSACPPSS